MIGLAATCEIKGWRGRSSVSPSAKSSSCTISEAVQLVVQAGAIGKTGEVLVLDMGKPVNIHDVAEQLVKNSGKPIKIEVVGLRVGSQKAKLTNDRATL